MFIIKNIVLLPVWLFGCITVCFSQQTDNLLSLVGDEKPAPEFVKYAFKSPMVISSHSMEFLSPGTLDFRILHRFGSLDQGYKNFFGLDQAGMRMSFDYGVKRNVMLGVGRSTYKKELDAYVKYGILMQQAGEGPHHPLSIVGVAGITLITTPWEDAGRKNFFSSRMAFYYHIIAGRKFNEALTIQLTPGLVHTNLVERNEDPNDVFTIGLGGRYKCSKRIAITWDYIYRLNGMQPNITYNPCSIGVDIETGGHVFQLHFTNAGAMNQRAVINETTQSWSRGEIRWGFNLSRVFQIRKKKVS